MYISLRPQYPTTLTTQHRHNGASRQTRTFKYRFAEDTKQKTIENHDEKSLANHCTSDQISAFYSHIHYKIHNYDDYTPFDDYDIHQMSLDDFEDLMNQPYIYAHEYDQFYQQSAE